MAPHNAIPNELARLVKRVAELERRLENTVREGPVAEVDPVKGLVRLKVGKGTDGTDQLSPWTPYAQQAGKLKIHTPPTVGQNMMMISAGGEFGQGFAIPVTWNKGNPSPSESGEENVLSYGDVTIVVKEDSVTASIGGFSVQLSAAGAVWSGGRLEHDGLDIGASHTHGGIVPGGSDTKVPNP